MVKVLFFMQYIFLGIGLGALNFFGLSWTVKKFVTEKKRSFILISLFARTAIFLGLFYLMMGDDYKKALLLLFGVFISRIIIVLLIKKGKFSENKPR